MPHRPYCLLLALLPLAATAAPLELEDCRISAGPGFAGIKARCGTLARPLNPDAPDAGFIELHVAVVPALDLAPAPDPVVPLAGGPGQGAVQFYSAYAGAFEPLRRQRDILLVDQRGTGASARMDCPIDDDIVEGEYSIELTIEYTKGCLESLPHDPRWFTTSVAVRDLEAVREALGYASLNLYGVSYGTRVAQHYARRYPATTRTVTLDGVVPPQIALGPEIATESQRAVESIFSRCADDPACAEHFPGIADDFRALTARLRESPVLVDVPHPNTGRLETLSFGSAEFAGAVRLLAYRPETIALLPLLVHEAAVGNFVPLAAQYRMTSLAMADALALGMHNAIMCTEDAPYYDAAIDRDGIAATYMGLFQLNALEAICSVWPAGPIDPGFRSPLEGDTPVLLLSGDADPITPPRYAELAAVHLDDAALLVGRHQGHGQIAVGCTSRLVAAFVDAASAADLDAGCLERSFVMPFFIDFSGPAP